MNELIIRKILDFFKCEYEKNGISPEASDKLNRFIGIASWSLKENTGLNDDLLNSGISWLKEKYLVESGGNINSYRLTMSGVEVAFDQNSLYE